MLRFAGWVGVVTAVYAVFLTLLFPREMGPLPAGMKTPIVAFELVRDRAEVETMFGSDDYDREVWCRQMDLGNRWDFGFLVAYGLFLFLFSRGLVERGGVSAQFGMRLAVVAAAMDALENLQLLAITRQLGGSYDEALSRLQWFTWLKWFAIAITVASWVPALWKVTTTSRLAARATAVAAVFTLLTTVAAFFSRGVFAELMALGVGLTLLGALTFAFRDLRSA